MRSRSVAAWCWSIALVLSALIGFRSPPAAVVADVVRMKNGGEVRGTLLNDPGTTSDQVGVQTLSGAVIVVDRRDVQFITERPLIVEEYESHVRQLDDSVDAHWQMAEWCNEHRLPDQRADHLRHVIRLAPDHAQAHRILGNMRTDDGDWLPREQVMERRGYVRYKGRYVTRQEMDVLEKSEQQRLIELEWFRKIRKLLDGLTGRGDERRRAAIIELREIQDPAAIPPFIKLFRDHSVRDVRAVYVDTVARIGGAAVVEPLVVQSLHDVDRDVRKLARTTIPADQYSLAADLYAGQLQHDSNLIVRRCGSALSEFGDERVVPQLIDALVTRHRYRVRVPDTNTVSFGSNGSFQLGGTPGGRLLPAEIEALLLTGQLPYGAIVLPPVGRPTPTRIVTVEYPHQNQEVHATLTSITGVDFGYDQRVWRLWEQAEKNGSLK